MIIGWYRTPVRLLENSFFCCCQKRLIKGVILSSASSRILVKSLLSSWSTSMFVFTIAARISFSSRSSSAHFSLCSCSVSLILSGSVFDTGALTFAGLESRLSFAFMVFLQETRYSKHCGHAPSPTSFSHMSWQSFDL